MKRKLHTDNTTLLSPTTCAYAHVELNYIYITFWSSQHRYCSTFIILLPV